MKEYCKHCDFKIDTDYVGEYINPREKIAELIKWLYINDGVFDNKNEWREALIKKLEELYV